MNTNTLSQLQQTHLQRVILGGKHYDLTHTIPQTAERFDQKDAARSVTERTWYSTHVDVPITYTHNAAGALDKWDVNQFILPLYVLHFENAVSANPDFELHADDIKDYEQKNGPIPPHSFVAFASDWSKRSGGVRSFVNQDQDGNYHTPGWATDALAFLHEERDVAAIGHETAATDAGKYLSGAAQRPGSAEAYWLATNKYQVEVLNRLKRLPTSGAIIFVSPIDLNSKHGYSARVYAIA